MKRATTVVLALGALLGGAAVPAWAQVVIGGEAQPSVEVNWAVLDRLGASPTLPDMLKSDLPGGRAATATAPVAAPPGAPKHQGVQYRPYKETPAKKAGVTKPKAAKPTPVVAKAEPKPAIAREVQELAEAAKTAKPAPAVKPEPAAVKPVGPQIALPEVAPAATPAKPAQPPKPEIAKVEPPKVEPPKIEAPKVEQPAPMKAEPAITPPPPPVAKSVEPPPAPMPAPLSAPAVVAPAVVPAIPQVASVPPSVPAPPAAGSAMHGDTLSVLFGGSDNAKLPDAARTDLQRLATRMEKDESLGLQLLAYAGGDDANASKARRLSLSRALEVRKYLMELGVRSTRIEVRALGNKVDSGPADRVDAVLGVR